VAGHPRVELPKVGRPEARPGLEERRVELEGHPTPDLPMAGEGHRVDRVVERGDHPRLVRLAGLPKLVAQEGKPRVPEGVEALDQLAGPRSP